MRANLPQRKSEGLLPRYTDHMFSLVDTVDLLEVAKGLALEFERRKMVSQLACLRQFYAAHKRARSTRPLGPWSAEMVLNWAALLKIPPMQHVYPLHAHAFVCPRCKDKRAVLRVEISWTDGVLVRCDGCGFKWLESH